MKFTTTDGQEYYLGENCPYCYPNTAGQHDIKCPLYKLPRGRPRVRILKFGDDGTFIKEIE